ncbi:BppU family phage baseplate upper protein [Clostridium sp.]|uniref:BppU family phage baseplate upper protein n=1 Tax=Clostridium sp. TaxID=1506 RepID=UPI00344E0C8E
MLTKFNKIYPLEIDIKNLQTTYNSKALYANTDLNTSVMLIKLTLDEKGLDITNKIVTAYIKTTIDGNITMQKCEILDSTEGIIGLDFKKSALKVGTNIFFIEIKSENNEIINTPLIDYKVVELFDTSNIFEDEENTNILSQLITDVETSKLSIKKCKEEINSIKSTIDSLNIEGINESITSINGEITSIKNSINSISADAINSEIGLVKEEISSIKEDILFIKEDIESVDIGSVNTEIDTIKTTINITNTEVSSIKEEVNTIKTSIKELNLENINETISTIKDSLKNDKKLIYKYIHKSNKVVKPSSLNLETGVFTCNNHNLTNGTKVVPIQDNFTDKLQNIHVELFKTGTQNLVITEATQDTFKIKNANGTINSFGETDNQEANLEKYHFEVLTSTKMDFTDIETDGDMEIKIHGYCGIGDLFFGLLKDGVLHKATNCFGGSTYEGAVALSAGVHSNFRMFQSSIELNKNTIGYMLSYGTQQHYINNGRNASSSITPKGSVFIQYPYDNINGIRLGSNGHAWQPINGMTLEIYGFNKISE